VTNALLLNAFACAGVAVYSSKIMKQTTPLRIKIRRFITDRYAYRTQPGYLFELLLFGIIMATAFLPLLFFADAVTGTLR
jgi:hypothetical protein